MSKHEISRNALSTATRCATVAAITFAIIVTSVFLASAGTLTPPGPPAATMRTLEEQKPAWNKIIPTEQRFVDALDKNASGAYEAVLDKETGLVWAKAPDSLLLRTWDQADSYCASLNLGGRMGWRLPTVAELSSLIDITNPGSPKLPVGQNMFQNVQSDFYWSSSTYAVNTADAWVVYMGGGLVGNLKKTNGYYVWPVRGGQ